MTAIRAAGRRPLLAALAALFVLVVVGRLVLVSLYAESVPYWDQWDAEGAHLIKPWLDGTLTVGQMFAPHNEHRILFTRLVSLALLEANHQQWDNLVGAYANVLIYAATPVLLFLLLGPGLRTRAAKCTLFLALLALAWLPYSQHNTLVAFQNQFFFMSLAAITCIGMAARARDDAWLPAKVLPAAVLGLFTMASGLLGAVAAGGVLALRLMVLRNLRPLRACIAIALLAAVAVGGYLAIPHIPGLDRMKADGVASWLHRFVSHLGWPLAGNSFAWIAIWLPCAIAGYRLLRYRSADARELIALGLGAWAAMQVAAIAYARDVLSDRYFDTLAIGLIANLWLAMRLLERAGPAAASSLGKRTAHVAPLSLLAVACVAGLARSSPHDIQAAIHRSALSVLQTVNVRQFVASGDRGFLDGKPRMHIPYPSSDRLAKLLADPTLRRALPASVRTSLPLGGQNGSGFISVGTDTAGSARVDSCGDRSTCRERTGVWLSRPMPSGFPYLQVPVEVDGATAGLSLSVVPGASPREIPPSAPRRGWLLLRVPPSAPFRLRSEDASPRSSLLFRAPVEVGGLSAMAMLFQDHVRDVLGLPSSEALRRGLSFAESPARDKGGTPLQLDPRKLAQIAWKAPRSGELAEVSTMLGNYSQQSDGLLALEACGQRACRSAQAWLRDSVDGLYFGVRFDQPLDVRAGEPLTFKFWSHRSTRPVAIFSYHAVPGSPRIVHFASIPPGALAGRSVRLRLGFVD